MGEKVFKDMDSFIERTTYQAVRRARDVFPNHEAIRYMGKGIAYDAFLRETDEIALRYARLGVKKGDVVLFCMPNVPNIVLSVYALHKIGAVVCPVHPQSSSAEISYYLRDTSARFAVCFAPLYPFVAEAKKNLGRDLTVITVAPEETVLFSGLVAPEDVRQKDVLTWKAFLSLSSPVVVEEATDPNALAVIFYSGGTTGQPKGIMLSCRNLNALAFQTEDGSGLIPMSDYSMLAVIPMFHGFGFGVNVHLMLATGGTTILIPKFSATDIGETILREKPNIIAGVPTLYYAITMALKDTDCDLSFLKGAFSGGDSVPQRIKDVFNAFAAAHNCDARLREGYGLTESVTVNCITDFSGGKKGSIGIPLVGNDFFIADMQTGAPLPFGQEGEICLSGPTVMLGYLNRPDMTEKVLRRENGKIVLHTGDRGSMDEDGYLYYGSRLSRIIITNGYNVYPAEVENAVSSVPDVKQACCIGVRDEIKGQSVCAIVVPREGADRAALRRAIEDACDELAEYKRPTLILFRDLLPLTKVGKIAYGEMQKQVEDSLVQKATSKEEALSLAAQKVLGVYDLSSAAAFFTAGGDSHKILVFLVALQQLGYELSLSDFATAETKEDVLAAMRPIAREEAEVVATQQYPEVEKVLREQNVPFEAIYPLTPTQEGILYYALTTHDHVYNVTIVLRVLRPIQKEVFLEAARLTLEKYEAFNTVFLPMPSGTYAVVRRDLPRRIEATTARTLKAYTDRLRDEGFDLKKEYGIRLSLVTADDGTFVVYNTHHAVSDGISDFNALSTLIRYYLTLEKDPTALPSLRKETLDKPFSYANYLARLREKNVQAAKDFFLRDLEGYEDEQYFFPSETGGRGYATITEELSKETEDSLRAFCSEKGYTLTMVSKALWAILLHKYGYSEDIVFGDVASGRDENVEGLSDAVGVFLTTIPNRYSVKGSDLVSSLLDQIRKKSLLYKAHDYLPAATVSDCLGRDVIRVLYNYHEDDGLTYGVGADTFVRCNLLSDSNYPLELEVTAGGRFALSIEFDQSVYDKRDVERLMRRLVLSFKRLPAFYEKPVSEFDVLTEEDEALLSEINDTAYPYDANETAIHRFLEQAKKTPLRVAVDSYDSYLTYDDLDRLSAGISERLTAAGVKKGDVVALYLSRSPEMIASIYGVLRMGGVYLPLDETYPADRLSFVLADSGAVLAVTDKTFPIDFPVLNVQTVEKGTSAPAVCRGDDRAYVIYTSGTTGTPKGVVTPHKGLSNLLLSYENVYGLTDTDAVLQVASYTFDQSVWDIFGVLAVGGRLVLISRDDVRDPERIAAVCAKKRVTIASFTPAMIAELDPRRFSTLRILDTSGEAANATVLRRWVERVTVVNTYGPTEYTVNACSYRYEGKENNVPIGKPILNTRFYVVGKGGARCGADMPGELYVAGDGLSEGYLNRPELTAEAFPSLYDEPRAYKTGDLVRLDRNGNVVYLRRIDSQVKVRGFRIETGEVDAAIRAAGVKDCHVCVKTVAGDNVLVAYVVGGNVASLRNKLSETLPPYMVPQYFTEIDRIPRTLAGKADERRLPVPTPSHVKKTLPFTVKQQAVAGVFRRLLGGKTYYLEDDFFFLGGDSIKAIRLSATLMKEGYFIDVRSVSELRTLGLIANAVTETTHTEQDVVGYGVTAEEAAYVRSYYGKERVESMTRVTPLQAGMLFRSMTAQAGHDYNTQIAVETNDLDTNVLKTALDLLVKKHAVLRSNFLWTERGGLQIVLSDRTYDFNVVDGNIDALIELDMVKSFDLADGSLFRVTYVRDGDKRYVIQNAHHALIDGWSGVVLLKDMRTFFIGLQRGQTFDVKPDYTFFHGVDYVVRADKTEARTYFREVLRDFAGGTLFPSRRYPEVKKTVKERLVLVKEVPSIAKSLSVSPAAILESTWGIVLGQATGTGDVVFGNVFSGRAIPVKGIDDAAGMFINTVPVRVRSEGKTPREVLADVVEQNRNHLTFGFLPLSSFPIKIDSVTVAGDFRDQNIRLYHVTDETEYDAEWELFSDCVYLRYNADRYESEDVDMLFRAMRTTMLLFRDAIDEPIPDVFSDKERALLTSRRPVTTVPVAPTTRPLQTEEEKLVAQAIESVLETPVANAGDDFFSLGGDSIKAIRLSAKLRSEGYALTVRDVMDGKTVDKIALRIRKEEAAKFALPKNTDEAYARSLFGDRMEKVFPLTPLQQGMLFHVCRDDAPEYLTQGIVKIPTPVDPDVPEKALRLLFARYEVLRSAFLLTETGGEQVIVKDRRPAFTVLRGDVYDIAKRDLLRGFDLENDVLFRVTYVRGKQDHLVLTCHHLLADGWSNGILYATYDRYCRRLLAGEEFDDLLAEAQKEGHDSLSFAEFIRYIHDKDEEKARAHYEELLRDFSGAYGYPSETDTRPPLGIAAERVVPFPCDLAKAARRLSTTQAVLLEAAWGICLGVRSGTGDSIFGNVLSGRNEPVDGIDELVGMLINTVPLRVRFTAKTTFRQILRQLEGQNADNLDYGFVPLTGKAAKMESVFVFNNFTDESVMKHVVAHSDQTSYDIELDVQEDDASFILRYNDKRYAEREADELCSTLSEALLSLTQSPDVKISDVFSPSDPSVARVVDEPDAPAEPLVTPQERIVARAMSEILEVPVEDANADFLTVGGDSIKAIRLSAKLRNAGYALSVKSIMEEKTVKKMALHVTDEKRSDAPMPYGDIPMTPVMKDFFRRDYPDPDAYVMEVSLLYDVASEDLLASLQKLYEHHDLLRARYTGSGLTVPAPFRSAPLTYFDLSGDLQTCVRKMRKSISLSSSLFASARIRSNEQTYVCLIAHHLIMDGVSIRILVEDLLTLLAGGELPQKSLPYRAYALAREDVVCSEREESYLRSLLPVEKTDFPVGIGTYTKERLFSSSFTDRFVRCGEFCSAKSDDVLLTALARAFRALTGRDGITVLKESHGRNLEGMDVTRTVGWFTSYYPLRAVGTGDPEKALIRNKESARSVPKDGVDLPYAVTKVTPDVIFNFMGSYDEAGDVPVILSPYEDDNPESEKLDFESEINDGKLLLSLRFNGVEKAFCDKLFDVCCAELTALVEEYSRQKAVPTPSDFGYPDMPLDDFYEVLALSPTRIAPLTPTQEGMLFHAGDAHAYVEQTATKVSVPLDKATAMRAFAYLSNKYAAFRTHYVLTKSGNLYQYLTEEADFPVEETTDWVVTAKKRIENGVSPFGRVPVYLDYQGDVVVITYHHVAFDLWSEDLLLSDLNAYLTGQAVDPSERLSFFTYALSRRDALSQEDAVAWNAIAEKLTATSLPVRGKERVQPVDILLPHPDKLEALSSERDVPVNVLLLALTAQFLQKACRQTEVSFAHAVSGRDAKNENAVGLYISTMPVCVREKAVEAILSSVGEQARLALRAPCPIEEILRRSQKTEAPDVLFLFNNLEVRGRTSLLSMYDRNHYGVTISVTKETRGYSLEIDLGVGSTEEANAYAALYRDCYLRFIGLRPDAYPVCEGESTRHAATLNALIDLAREDFFVIDERRVDGREILQKALSLSASLHERTENGVIGVKTRDPLTKLVALYAVTCSGNAFLPIDPDCPAERESVMLSETNASFVLTDEFVSGFSYDERAYLASPEPNDVAYILYTSGSTGKPKGVKISHNAIANRLVWMEKVYPLRGGAILQKTPYTFDVSLWELFRPLLFGGTLVTMRGAYSSPKDVEKRIRKGEVTQIHFVPSSYEVFLDAVGGKAPTTIRDVFLSGEKLSASVAKKHFAVFGDNVRLHNLYGPTECAVDVTYYDVTGEESEIPIGRPVDNVTISIESCGETVPPYLEGEIVVRGENVGLGYVGSEQGGFTDGAYRTGDVGYTDGSGTVYFLRRDDSLVKLHGARVSLTEIENALTSIDGVSAAAVLVLGGENGYLCAFYVGENADLEQSIKRKLPAYLRPTRYVKLRAIPLTKSGKRDDEALRNAADRATSSERVSGERERVFLSLVREGLRKDVGFDEAFSQAEVSSLDRIRLAVKLSSVCEFGDVVRAGSARELFLSTDRSFFMPFTSGNSKALILFPYAGGTGRAYENVRVDGYDVYAAVTSTFDERDLPAVLCELRAIVAKYDETAVYAHCLGALTAARLLEDLPVTQAIFGGHVPDPISSFFGRPVDGWKRVSDKSVLAALQKGGLRVVDGDLTYFFRKDVRRAAILEAEKHVFSVPTTVLLADEDPFTPNVRAAQSRWKKLSCLPVTVRILHGKNHYFVSDDDFGAILSSVLGGKA